MLVVGWYPNFPLENRIKNYCQFHFLVVSQGFFVPFDCQLFLSNMVSGAVVPVMNNIKC